MCALAMNGSFHALPCKRRRGGPLPNDGYVRHELTVSAERETEECREGECKSGATLLRKPNCKDGRQRIANKGGQDEYPVEGGRGDG